MNKPKMNTISDSQFNPEADGGESDAERASLVSALRVSGRRLPWVACRWICFGADGSSRAQTRAMRRAEKEYQNSHGANMKVSCRH